MTNVAILALEPDPAQAATIRHIVRELVRVELRIVGSKNELLLALSAGVPDLILLPALLSQADEAELLAHLSTLQDSGHLEMLVTPFLFAPQDSPAFAPRSWRQYLGRGKSRPRAHACDRRAFAEQLMWSLRRADEVRQEHAARYWMESERNRPSLSAATAVDNTRLDDAKLPEVSIAESLLPHAMISDASVFAPIRTLYSDRRAHRRFPADELRALRGASIEHGPPVRLVDCSTGGALLESDVPLRPETEAMLEIVGEMGRSVVPVRVVRCQVSVFERRLLYWGACAFTRPLELTDLLRPRSDHVTASTIDHPDRLNIADSEPASLLAEPDEVSAPLEDVLAPYRRRPMDQSRRDNRLTRREVPWLSAVKLSWGLEVSLLNISSTGLLVETTSKFTPGSVTEFLLCTPDTSLVVPARFVRSEVAEVDSLSVRYHAAAVFARELHFPVYLGSGGASSTPKALAELLTHVVTDMDRDGKPDVLRTKYAQGVRSLVSALDIQIRDVIEMPPHGSESIYFTVPSAFGSRAILQVTFEPGHELDEREFRLLKSAATLAAVVLEFEKMPLESLSKRRSQSFAANSGPHLVRVGAGQRLTSTSSDQPSSLEQW